MGMYTEFVLGIELKKDTPEDVISALNHMTKNAEPIAVVPIHPLFETNGWEYMLTSSSYYFDGDTHSSLRRDNISKSYHLTIRCDFKNYDSEIEKFLNWIIQYSNTVGFVGYSRYETNENPYLIYFNNGKVEIR